jgi:hypothetical protein
LALLQLVVGSDYTTAYEAARETVKRFAEAEADQVRLAGGGKELKSGRLCPTRVDIDGDPADDGSETTP